MIFGHSLESCILLGKVMTSLVAKSGSVLRGQSHVWRNVQVHRPEMNITVITDHLIFWHTDLSRVNLKSDHSSSPHLTPFLLCPLLILFPLNKDRRPPASTWILNVQSMMVDIKFESCLHLAKSPSPAPGTLDRPTTTVSSSYSSGTRGVLLIRMKVGGS